MRVEGREKGAKVQKLTKNEMLMVNIGSLSAHSRVVAVKADLAKIVLTKPGMHALIAQPNLFYFYNFDDEWF